MENNESQSLYEIILDSPLMNDLWDEIDATTKYQILEKAGFNMVEEYEKVKNDL